MKKANMQINLLFSIILVLAFVVLLIIFSGGIGELAQRIFCARALRAVRQFNLGFYDETCSYSPSLESRDVLAESQEVTSFLDGEHKKDLYFYNVRKNVLYFSLPSNARVLNAYVDAALNPTTEVSVTVSNYEIENISAEKKSFNLTEGVSQYILNECKEDPCRIPLGLSSANTTIKVDNLKVEYRLEELNYLITSSIIDCWERSFEGKFKDDFMCDEIFVSEEQIKDDPVTEKNVSQILIQKSLCEILPNSDYGCGDDDLLEFAYDFYSQGNILIKYEEGMIKVE